MTSTSTRPLALKILIALLLLEGGFAWFRFLSGVLSEGWNPLTLTLVLPFAAWGLYRLVPSWRVLTLVYAIIHLILGPLSYILYVMRESQAEGLNWLRLSAPAFAADRPLVLAGLVLIAVVLWAWYIYVLRRRDITLLFNGEVRGEEPKESY